MKTGKVENGKSVNQNCSQTSLVGGFSPTHLKHIKSNWIISPGKGENKKCLKPPPRSDLGRILGGFNFPKLGS